MIDTVDIEGLLNPTVSSLDILSEDQQFYVDADGLPICDHNSFVLPKHQCCAAHTLNLISSTDIRSALETPSYKRQSRQTFAKCNNIWNKQNRSKLVADSIKNAIGIHLITPNETRWNSTFDSVKCTLKYLQPTTKINILCNSLKIVQFSKTDILFLEEFVKTMSPISIALDTVA
ncbi:Uncharacterized protein FWK35_00037197 [Aphis craccivora]|uniref:Uncharacterized protein n=1 Tax=Aphis craccivora TaxID=307492 RepID=A0A6G0VP53_APHCR|nr:Uncharacterized protein FWK35_00037197 [Aphis craccivora]